MPYSNMEKVYGVMLLNIMSERQTGELYKIILPENSSIFMEVFRSRTESTKINVLFERKGYQEMVTFRMGDVTSLQFSSVGNTIISFTFSSPPRLSNAYKNSVDIIVAVAVEELRFLQIHCSQIFPPQLIQSLLEECKFSREVSPMKRKHCSNCECCEDLTRQIKRVSLERDRCFQEKEEEDKKKIEIMKEMKEFFTAGITDDFEKQVYNPLISTTQKLKSELSEIKSLLYGDETLLDYRMMGLLNPDILDEADISDEDASIIYHDILMNPLFNPSATETVENLREWVGDDVTDDIIRAWGELQQYNPSGGYPIAIPWDEAKDHQDLCRFARLSIYIRGNETMCM